MQDFIYTTQGIIAKSDILESFVSNSEVIDGEDLYGRAGVIVFDESLRGRCDFSSCRIKKPEQSCVGIKKEIKLQDGSTIPQDPAHWDLGQSTCTLECNAMNNATKDAKGCLCSTYVDKKDGLTKERCQSRQIKVAFPDNRKPCVAWDPSGTGKLKIDYSITGCKATTEGFSEQGEEDALMPFFNQRMFRPSWTMPLPK